MKNKPQQISYSYGYAENYKFKLSGVDDKYRSFQITFVGKGRWLEIIALGKDLEKLLKELEKEKGDGKTPHE